MQKIRIVPLLLTLTWITSKCHAYYYNPYHQFFRYGEPYFNPLYGHPVPSVFPTFDNAVPYNPYASNDVLTSYPRPVLRLKLNVLAEVPSSIKTSFGVLPLYVISSDDINVIANPLIVQVSHQKPTMRVKTVDDSLTQCTPAAKIFLDKPLSVYSLKSEVMFPTDIEIVHDGFKIPIRVGALLAPVSEITFVSPETPVLVRKVYAVPTRPFSIEPANPSGTVAVDNQSVVVENSIDQTIQQQNLPPKNVTVLEFPETEAEPSFQVNEDDDELVNRNPPIGVIPAGIVQSTQPIASIQQFTNSKESPLLTTLREEASKLKVKLTRQ